MCPFKIGHGTSLPRQVLRYYSQFCVVAFSEDQAPEGISYNFETIRNIDTYLCELAPTVREGIRGWNMTVQWWLASHVYKRLNWGQGHVK